MLRSPQIRRATQADLAAICQLEHAATTAAHWSERQYREALGAGAPLRLFLVAEETAGDVLGFLIARCVGEEWELENIVVAQGRQRRGVASFLLKHFLDHAGQSGAHWVHLEVRQSNHPARALYEKWGFVETGRRRSYYSDPEEDAILYRFSFQKDRV
jgi:ribosomal-protein-alanine N-acetyltransferase